MSLRDAALLQRDVRNCTKCPLNGTNVPPTIHPTSPLLIIGEAPSADEVKAGRPFGGRSGKLMRALVREAGFMEDEVSYGNAVSCLPAGNDKAARVPSRSELAACRDNVQRLIESVAPRVVLLTGGTALGTWRTDLSVSKHRGCSGWWGGRWVVMSTFHPASVLRGQEANRHAIREDLENCRLICDGMDWQAFQMDVCSACGGRGMMGEVGVLEYDVDGVGFCDRHWKTKGGAWKRDRKMWKVEVAKVMQEKML